MSLYPQICSVKMKSKSYSFRRFPERHDFTTNIHNNTIYQETHLMASTISIESQRGLYGYSLYVCRYGPLSDIWYVDCTTSTGGDSGKRSPSTTKKMSEKIFSFSPKTIYAYHIEISLKGMQRMSPFFIFLQSYV